MAERHKSKYKKPENAKPTHRKDLKDYTYDDKKGGMNPKTTGEKQFNVLRKKDKPLQDDGKLYPKYNSDDRLYKDIEDGEWEPKIAAKRLKKRQDTEEKETADVLQDKIENLTREQREILVREYVRRKIVKVLREQPDPSAKNDEPTAPADAPSTPTPAAGGAAPAPSTPAPTDPSAAPAPNTSTPATGAAAPASEPAANTQAPTPDTTAPDDKNSEKTAQQQISPETKEALDIDRFVKYLDKQDGNIAKVKSLLKVINLATKNLDTADIANTFKMLKIATTKKLAKLNQQNISKQ